MSLFPIFLKLKNKMCLVVGGGRVAERKVKKLLEADAAITVIAPEITEELENLAKRTKIVYKNENYKPGNLHAYFLVIASTDSDVINNMINSEAEENNILVNSVDDPENCNFIVPSLLERGDLQIAVSSSGKVPYFTKKLRQYLEKMFYQEMGKDIDKLHVLRKNIIKETKNIKNNKDIKEKKFENILNPKIEKIFEKLGC